MNPVVAVELLFFAIFGQTTHEHFIKVGKDQPYWTTILFKLTFGIYMLVSVVVLINLLIAMMSDTYQRIQAQSDIEWKYGLSKLVRNMHRTTTAPSPLNLVTSWMSYFCKMCKKRSAKKQRPSLVHLMGLNRSGRMSPRSKMGAKWLGKIKKTQVAHKDSVALSVVHLSPLGSQLSFSNALRIDTVVDWDAVRRKYRELYGGDSEKPVEENKDAAEPDPLVALEVKANPIEVNEKLFFAIFGQKDTDDFMTSLQSKLQPAWTVYLFKISFSAYMLVSVIVLINLLIAMMSDTYQSIQSQSDIEWKYGLSKLIRNMQKTRTAPSPLNLFTTWIIWLNSLRKKRKGKPKRLSVMHGLAGYQGGGGQAFTGMLVNGNSSAGKFSRFQESLSGSQFSFRHTPTINTVVDWNVVRKKYRMRFGDEVEKPSIE